MKRGRVNRVADEKEKEIERLAEDNRQLREILLTRFRVPIEILEYDRADSTEMAKDRLGPGGK